jgi:hypothetical protein
MFQVLLESVYVTLERTRPGMPLEELAGSSIVKVIEVSDTAVTLNVRKDQLLVPLCRVFAPSFASVTYVTLSMVYLALPMRLTYRPGIAFRTG